MKLLPVLNLDHTFYVKAKLFNECMYSFIGKSYLLAVEEEKTKKTGWEKFWFVKTDNQQTTKQFKEQF